MNTSRYVIDGRVGQGSMGTVYKARPAGGHQPVAIKRVPVPGDQELSRRLRHEADLLSELRHPNIVKVLDVLDDGDGVAVVMEWAGGGNLADQLVVRGRLAAAEVSAMAASVADALEAAHAHGVLHCDVKPANILFNAEGRVVLSDFGLARWVARQSIWGGAVVGTAEYLDPEVAEGRTPDARSDIYSLAVVCYEALAGRVPFSASTPLATLRAAERGRAVSVGDLVPELNPALARAVHRGMARKRKARFVSAADFGAALSEAEPGIDRIPELAAVRSRLVTDGSPTGPGGSAPGQTVGGVLFGSAASLAGAPAGGPGRLGVSLSAGPGPIVGSPVGPVGVAAGGPPTLEFGRGPLVGPHEAADVPQAPRRRPWTVVHRRRGVVVGAAVLAIGTAAIAGVTIRTSSGPRHARGDGLQPTAVALATSGSASGPTDVPKVGRDASSGACRGDGGDAGPAGAGPARAGPATAGPATAGPGSAPPAPPVVTPASSAGAETLTADVWGSGCVPVVWADNVATVAGPAGGPPVRFGMGEPGDVLVLGDWTCQHRALPALYRPQSGELFVFARWADPDMSSVTATVLQTGIRHGMPRVDAGPPGRGECDRVVVVPQRRAVGGPAAATGKETP